MNATDMNANIADKVVVITGASSGIGEAAARHLTALGAPAALGARRMDRLEAIVKDIRTAGGKAEAFATDVTRRTDVEDLVGGALKAFGRIDVMVNNAGLMPLAPLAALKVNEWERLIDVNIKGVLYGIAAALPHMLRQGSGHFINLSSVAGHKVFPGGAVYSATKFAVRVLSEGLRQESGPRIRSTIISPGAIATELPQSITDPASAEQAKQLYQVAIAPDAVARAIAFAIAQPADVDINEIIVRPTAQEH